MGLHYFQLNYDVNAACDNLTPIQLLYSGGVLNGKYLIESFSCRPVWYFGMKIYDDFLSF